MGFLERAIRQGISRGVGDAIGKAVQSVVEPKATEFVNNTANRVNEATNPARQQVNQTSSELEGALGNLKRSMEGYATEAAKNVKICPSCNEGCSADKKFCPNCGEKLPETTVAEGAVCTKCGKQNSVGTKFCQECGEKLPAAIEQEQAAKLRNDNVMAEWDEKLSQYPKWNCGGTDFNIEYLDGGYIMFAASFDGNSFAAQQAVENYRAVLLNNGFREAGQYPSKYHLYKKENGVCFHVDTEHCFDGDSDCPTLGFNVGEPSGGFDYVKPEPKKQIGLRDLFKF